VPVAIVALAPDGQRLAAAGIRGVSLCRPSDVDFRPLAPGGCEALAFNPAGDTLAVLRDDGVALLDASGRALRTLPSSDWTGPVPWQLRFAPDGTELWAARARLFRWDTRTWKRLPSRPPRRTLGEGLMIAPDGRTAAVAKRQPGPRKFTHTIRFHDLVSGEDRSVVEMPSGDLTGERIAAFSPDSRVYASFHRAHLWAWEVPTGRSVFRSSGGRHFRALAFTPNGRSLLVARDSTVQILDTATWAEVSCLDWGIGRVSCLAVAADGLTAAVGSDSGRVIVWDLEN
jgi:WD40 repeat protein